MMLKIKNIYKAKDLLHLPKRSYFLNMVNYEGDILPEQFQFDNNLEFIALSSQSKIIGRRAFASCTQLSRIDCTSKVVSDHAFAFCKCLKEFNFLQTMKIEEGAFEYTGLREVSFSNALTIVPKSCFNDCLDLKLLNLNNVEEIEEEAFSCTSIPVLNMPRSLRVIGKKAFYGSFFLTDIICERMEPPRIASTAFIGCPLTNVWVFSDAQADLYKKSPSWRKYVNLIKVTTTKDLQNYLKNKAKCNASNKMVLF